MMKPRIQIIILSYNRAHGLGDGIRSFLAKTYRDLDQFLSQVGPTEFDGYRQAIGDFLQSKAFEPFYQDHFARNLLAAIEGCVLR